MKFASNLQLQMIQILTNDVQMLILYVSYFVTTVISKENFVSRVRLTGFQKYSYNQNNFYKDLDDFKFTLKVIKSR